MKWIRFTLDTHTDAVDMLSYMLDEIGVEGIEIEDHLPLSEEDKKKCLSIFYRTQKITMGLQKFTFTWNRKTVTRKSHDSGTEYFSGNQAFL